MTKKREQKMLTDQECCKLILAQVTSEQLMEANIVSQFICLVSLLG